MTKNYSSIYDIKKFAMTEIMPKFFDTDDINTFNIGLLGYINELIGNITEDTFNAMNFLLPEMYPNKAKLKDSIYSTLALYRYNDIFAKAANASFALFIPEESIMKYAEEIVDDITDTSTYTFTIDRDMVIDVAGLSYMMDYDLVIKAKEYKSNLIFQAKYNKSFINSLSTISTPYLNSKRVKVSGKRYLMVAISAHQVTKHPYDEPLISNDVLNMPTIEFTYTDNLCGFNIFYRVNDSSAEVQLTKQLTFSTPLKTPFCYYRIRENNTVEVTFTAKDEYFQPAFGSTIRIEYYTTRASEGNFSHYIGTDIIVKPSSDNYSYNNGLILMATVQSESKGGSEEPTFEELQSKAVELLTTVDTVNTEEDLQTYFLNYSNEYGNSMMFAKLRDDALRRRYSAFLLLRDTDDTIYPTNTLNIDFSIYNEDYDKEYPQTNRWIFNAGRVFRLKDNSNETLVPIGHLTVADDLTAYKYSTLYASPFMISVCKYPQSTSFYLNTMNDQIKMDYKYANENAFYQFNCNKLTLTRNGIYGSTQYDITVALSPSADLPIPAASYDADGNLIDAGVFKAYIVLWKGAIRNGYIELTLSSFDEEADLYVFHGSLDTDDYITSENDIRLTNVYSWGTTDITGSVLVPMEDTVMELAIFFNDTTDSHKDYHEFSFIEGLEAFDMTNLYIMDSEKCSLMKPMDCIDSSVSYTDEKVNHIDVKDTNIQRPTGMSLSSITKIENDNTIHGVEIVWDPYVDLTGSGTIATYLLVIDDDYANPIELSKTGTTNIYTQDLSGCHYLIYDYPMSTTKKFTIGYRVKSQSTVDKNTYVYKCQCEQTTGIDKLGDVCGICGTKVVQFLDVDVFIYSCTCGDIGGEANAGVTCNTCHTLCIRSMPDTDGYSCDCGLLEGEISLGRVCSNCGTIVVDEDSDDSTRYYYSCEGGELTGIVNQGDICPTCETICRRKYTDLVNVYNVITWSAVGTIRVGIDTTVYVENPEETTPPIYTPSIPSLATGNKLTMLISEIENTFNVLLHLVPIAAASSLSGDDFMLLLTNLASQVSYMSDVVDKMDNNFGISLKFYNTYGYSKNFTTDTNVSIGNIGLSLKLGIKPVKGALVDELFTDIKIYIKEYIEKSNNSVANELFISNLTTAIEKYFTNVQYCKYIGINSFGSEIQAVVNNSATDLSSLTKGDRLIYVPEYMTISTSNISLIDLSSKTI